MSSLPVMILAALPGGVVLGWGLYVGAAMTVALSLPPGRTVAAYLVQVALGLQPLGRPGWPVQVVGAFLLGGVLGSGVWFGLFGVGGLI